MEWKERGKDRGRRGDVAGQFPRSMKILAMGLCKVVACRQIYLEKKLSQKLNF